MNRIVVTALLVAACGGGERQPTADPAPAEASALGDCGLAGEVALSGRGIGALLVGAPLDSVRSKCLVLADSMSEDDEGNPLRRVWVAIREDTVHAVVDSGRIWRIEISSSRLNTSDSLGVGSTIFELLAAGAATGAEGEEGLYVMLGKHCGVSFLLDTPISDDAHRENWSQDQLARITGTARVKRVLLSGCAQLSGA